ncbi:hypothetical protein MMC21_004513 [Puttea exsequens]|nr:hypothetical protein [Puttea exsequens]
MSSIALLIPRCYSFGDETEDSPTSSEWRSPCPCALTAHESCLLDWVADLEAPSNIEAPKKEVECPQCKSKITISRPRSLVVEGAQAVQRASGRLAIPFMVVTLVGTVVTGCWVHGLSAVYLTFGPKEAESLMGINHRTGMDIKWGFGLPLIPLAIIASRFTKADSFLQILPVFYFASNVPQRNGPLWPPSAAITVATLPYLRVLYNELYARVLEPYEKLWTQQVRPRAGGQANIQGNEFQGLENGNVIEMELGVDVELVDEADMPGGIEPQREGPVANPPAAGAAAAVAGNNGGNPINDDLRNHGPPGHHGHQAAGGNWAIDILQASRTIVGALLFPTVSAMMGNILNLALPKTWTTPPGRWERYPPGFLQSRFGRSIAGGCLFVVLKDSFRLFAKYRLAQINSRRRVMDFQHKGQ